MSVGLAFWIIMLLWLVLGILPRANWSAGWRAWSGDLLLFILLLLLGWGQFGAPIHG